MNFSITMTLAVLVAVLGTCMAGVIPAAVAAPAAIGYARAVPYNIPPFASRVDISTRALAAPYVAAPVVAAPAAPYVAAPAAPYVAAPAAPYVAAPAAPYVASPYGALAAPVVAAPGLAHSTYAGSYAAPLAHAAVAAHGPAVLV